MKPRYYAVIARNGDSEARIFEGWAPVRRLLDGGANVRILSAATPEICEKRVREFADYVDVESLCIADGKALLPGSRSKARSHTHRAAAI